MAKDTSNLAVDRRRDTVGIVAAHIHDSLRMQHQLQKNSESSPLPTSRMGGN